jgi:hypothetical protein
MAELIAVLLIAGYILAMIVLARAILTRMDRYVSHEATRTITIETPLGDDTKLQRIEQRLLNRGATILDLDYQCDVIHDREKITLLVAPPNRHPKAQPPATPPRQAASV